MQKGMRPADGKRKVGCPNFRVNIEAGYRCLHLEDAHLQIAPGSPCVAHDCRCGGGPGGVLANYGIKALSTMRLLAELPDPKERPVAVTLFGQPIPSERRKVA